MNLKKIWEGIKERKVEPPVFLYRCDTHLIAYCADQPDFVMKSEQTAADLLGIEFTPGPMTAIIIRDPSDDEFGVQAMYFMGDLRKDLLPIMTDVDKLKEFVEEHKDKLSPGSQMVKLYANDKEGREKAGIGFVKHSLAA